MESCARSVYRECGQEALDVRGREIVGEGAFEIAYKLNEWQLLKVSKHDLLTDTHSLVELAMGRLFLHPNARKLLGCSAVNQGGNLIAAKVYALRNTVGDVYQLLLHSPGHRKAVLYQIVRFLYDMHRLGIVHGDLKTGNILMHFVESARMGNGSGSKMLVAEVSDFGSCLLLPHAAKGVATLNFRAPEAWLRYQVTSAAIDMWGLGMIALDLLGIHEMLTATPEASYLMFLEFIHGISVSNGTTVVINPAAREMLKERIDEASNDSLEVDFVLRCLDPVAANRITSAEALAHPYFRSAATSLQARPDYMGVRLFDAELTNPGAHEVPDRWWMRLINVFNESLPGCSSRSMFLAADMAYRARSRSSGMRPEVLIDADAHQPIGYGAILLASEMLECGMPTEMKNDTAMYEAARRGARWLLLVLDGALINPRAIAKIATGSCEIPSSVSVMQWFYAIS